MKLGIYDQLILVNIHDTSIVKMPSGEVFEIHPGCLSRVLFGVFNEKKSRYG